MLNYTLQNHFFQRKKEKENKTKIQSIKSLLNDDLQLYVSDYQVLLVSKLLLACSQTFLFLFGRLLQAGDQFKRKFFLLKYSCSCGENPAEVY